MPWRTSAWVGLLILLLASATGAQMPASPRAAGAHYARINPLPSYSWKSPIRGQFFTELNDDLPAPSWSIGGRVDLSDIPKLGDTLNDRFKIESFEISVLRRIGLGRLDFHELLMTWESQRFKTAMGRLSFSGEYDHVANSGRSARLDAHFERRRFTFGAGIGLDGNRFIPTFVFEIHGRSHER